MGRLAWLAVVRKGAHKGAGQSAAAAAATMVDETSNLPTSGTAAISPLTKE